MQVCQVLCGGCCILLFIALNSSGPSGAVRVGGASEMLRRPPGEMQILIWLWSTMLLTPLLALTGVAGSEVPMQP